jgi:hypothetical protein
MTVFYMIELIDATFVLLIISIGCWFVALFADKPEQKKNSKTTDLEKQSPTSMSNSKNTDIEKQSPLSKSSDSTTSSTIAASKKTNRNSNKPPKQLPVITMTDEDQSADEGVSEVTKLLVTSTKTEVIKEKRISSISDHMRSSIQDTDITPLKALDPSTEPSRSYVGRRSVSADPKPIEPTIAEEKKNDSTEKEPEKTTNDK